MTTDKGTTAMPTISERLADHVVGLGYDDLPGPVVDKAKDHLVHHFGVAFRGHGSGRATQGIGAGHRFGGTGGPSSIVGEPGGTDLLASVFANSILMGHDGLDDVVLPPGVHPGVTILPAALAVGERTHASGRELLAAVIAGYDVMVKLHSPTWSWELKLPRPTQWAVAPFGAAAAAARLFGLSHGQAVNAFGHAGQAGAGVYEGVDHHWIMHAHAARNGVMAAMLAKAGMPASPTIVEGRNGVYRSFFLEDVPDAVYDNLAMLGRKFAISHAEVKPHPVGILNSGPVKLTCQLVADYALTATNVASLDVVLPAARERREAVYDDVHLNGPRRLVAMVLKEGSLDPAHLAYPPDRELLATRRKVRLRFEANHPLRYARIEVTTTNGNTYSAEGHASISPPSLEWTESLDAGRRANLAPAQLTRLAELIRNLDNATDVSQIMTCVVPKECDE